MGHRNRNRHRHVGHRNRHRHRHVDTSLLAGIRVDEGGGTEAI